MVVFSVFVAFVVVVAIRVVAGVVAVAGQEGKMQIKDVLKADVRHELVTGLERDKYFSSCGLNPSSLAKGWLDDGIDVSAIRYAYEGKRAPLDQEKRDQIDQGTLGHLFMLEPWKLDDEVAIWTGGRRAGKEWEKYKEDNDGKLLIRQADFDRVEECCRVVLDQFKTYYPQVFGLIAEGEQEVAVFSEEYGMQTKGLIDWINVRRGVGTIVDLKFSEKGTDSHIVDRNVRRFQYDTKIACYRRWFERESGKDIRECVNITVCTTAPYGVIVKRYGDTAYGHGWDKAKRLLQATKKAIETDRWPMFLVDEEYIPPAWEHEEESDVF